MKNRKVFFSLDKKILTLVLVVNTVYTLCWTFISFRFLQHDEFQNQLKELKYVESVIIPAVANSVWQLDQEQTRIQLQGVLANPRVVRVQIVENGATPSTFLDIGKNEKFNQVNVLSYDLKPPVGDGDGKFATLNIFTTLDPVMARMRTEIYRYFLSEAFEILILSVLILYTFRILVLNRLGQISKFFRENSYIAKKTPYFLPKRRTRAADEIDVLIDALNRTIDESKKYQSEIERLKDQAEKANQAKSMFLASINHELRTPLNAILGVAELLPETEANSGEMKQLVDMQKRSGQHLLHLVDEILDFSKIEAGEIKIENQVIEISKVFENCRSMMESLIKERGNRLECRVDPDFPKEIMGDPGRISQILLNLTSNANKFTENGLISVTARADKINYCLSVKDSGKGIPENKLNEIFLPFRQLDNQPNQSLKGTGIGLSITKRLVDFMKGEIHVESKLGFGSNFEVVLPLRLPETASTPEPDPSAKAVQGVADQADSSLHKKVRLLVIEDTPEVQMLIKAYLKGLDVELTFAENGAEGVEKFEHDDPNMILMDLQMPVMNGYEATEKIRKLEQNFNHPHHVPILALTALTTKNDLEKALQCGCDGYMTKPLSRSKLLQTLREEVGMAS